MGRINDFSRHLKKKKWWNIIWFISIMKSDFFLCETFIVGVYLRISRDLSINNTLGLPVKVSFQTWWLIDLFLGWNESLWSNKLWLHKTERLIASFSNEYVWAIRKHSRETFFHHFLLIKKEKLIETALFDNDERWLRIVFDYLGK